MKISVLILKKNNTFITNFNCLESKWVQNKNLKYTGLPWDLLEFKNILSKLQFYPVVINNENESHDLKKIDNKITKNICRIL